MHCPTLKDLPPPPEGKTGWPWTEGNSQLPKTMPDGKPWAKISIITPNYNYGRTVEEAIRSVLLQGYPNLEYIIIDGGSADNSLEIIKRYERWLGYWVSESDEGIYDAINKGIKVASGEWIYVLGSDDILYHNKVLYEAFSDSNNINADIIYGNVFFKYSQKKYLGKFNFGKLQRQNICHQAIFFRKKVFKILGLYDTTYKILADYEFNFRWITDKRIKKKYYDKIIAIYRERGISFQERDVVFRRNFSEIFYQAFQKLSVQEKILYVFKELIFLVQRRKPLEIFKKTKKFVMPLAEKGKKYH